jgi:tetratricopeptide (TPR) repeat protein
MSDDPTGPAADRNLLFGVLALQADLLDAARFAEACTAWSARKDTPLADLLLDRGWLTAEERAHVEFLLNRKLKKHGGDARAGLAEVADEAVRHTLAAVADPIVHQTLAGLPADSATLATITADFRPAADGTRFQVLRPHARGGLGLVSVARDTELGREVALKEIQSGHAEDAASRGRFVREAEITGGLEHPGVVPVYGLGRYADGRPYYAMRLIRGESLQEAVRKLHADESGSTLRGLLTRFVAVCNTVAYAHSRGVLHRDLKPANVMLGPYGETLVVDWGLAKVVGRETHGGGPGSAELTLRTPSGEGSATLAGAALGTPAYMSPEQARGEVAGLGPATDVYSLGATLYTLLAGQAPVHGRDTAEVLEKVRQGHWLPPRQVKPSVPKALDAVCRKAMALQPGERYASALALAVDVERWLADEPVSAWREPWGARVRRWTRRHRTAVVGTAVATGVTLLLVGGGLVWRQRDIARRQQEQEREHAEQRSASESALKHVEDLQSKARWGEAGAALDQAEARLVNPSAADLRGRAAEMRRNLQIVARIDAVRLGPATDDEGLFRKEKDREYRTAFSEAGLGQPGDDPATAAAVIAGSPLREVLVEALDDWALVASDYVRAWALAVARQADPDPWRDKLRDPAAWQHTEVLARWLREAPAESVTPGLAAATGAWLYHHGEGDWPLRTAQTRMPGDFWLNRQLAATLLADRRLADAESYARAALALRPLSAAARGTLAAVLLERGRVGDRGRVDEAETVFRRAIDLDPQNVYCLNGLGLLLQTKKPDEAEALLRKAIKIGPNLPDPQNNLALILEDKGKISEAEAAFRRIVASNPDYALGRANLGRMLLSRGKLDEAEPLIRKAIELDPNKGMPHRMLGEILYRRGRSEESASQYHRALEINPQDYGSLSGLGILCTQIGKTAEAESWFRKGINAAGERDSFTLLNLADTLMRQGRCAEALTACRKAIDVAPNGSEARAGAYLNFAEANLGMGQYSAARDAARAAVAQLPRGSHDPEYDATVRQAAIGERLASVLNATSRPSDAAEALDFAVLCRYQWRLADAARLYSYAFEVHPRHADDSLSNQRFSAACCAALAACGAGEGPALSDKERALLHRQAREWLRHELASARRMLAAPGGNDAAVRQLERWFSDDDLRGVRDAARLEQLPEAERKEWQAFWTELRALLANQPAK